MNFGVDTVIQTIVPMSWERAELIVPGVHSLIKTFLELSLVTLKEGVGCHLGEGWITRMVQKHKGILQDFVLAYQWISPIRYFSKRKFKLKLFEPVVIITLAYFWLSVLIWQTLRFLHVLLLWFFSSCYHISVCKALVLSCSFFFSLFSCGLHNSLVRIQDFSSFNGWGNTNIGKNISAVSLRSHSVFQKENLEPKCLSPTCNVQEVLIWKMVPSWASIASRHIDLLGDI